MIGRRAVANDLPQFEARSRDALRTGAEERADSSLVSKLPHTGYSALVAKYTAMCMWRRQPSLLSLIPAWSVVAHSILILVACQGCCVVLHPHTDMIPKCYLVFPISSAFLSH